MLHPNNIRGSAPACCLSHRARSWFGGETLLNGKTKLDRVQRLTRQRRIACHEVAWATAYSLASQRLADPQYDSDGMMLAGLLARARRRLEKQLSGHGDRRLKTTVDGAFVGEDAMNAVGGLPVRLFGLQLQPHMNATDARCPPVQSHPTRPRQDARSMH